MKALKAAVQKHARILTWCGWISSAILLLLSFDAFFSGVVMLRLRPAPARSGLLYFMLRSPESCSCRGDPPAVCTLDHTFPTEAPVE